MKNMEGNPVYTMKDIQSKFRSLRDLVDDLTHFEEEAKNHSTVNSLDELHAKLSDGEQLVLRAMKKFKYH